MTRRIDWLALGLYVVVTVALTRASGLLAALAGVGFAALLVRDWLERDVVRLERDLERNLERDDEEGDDT